VTWDDAIVAGAFAVGVVAGGIGVVLTVRYLLGYLRGERGDKG